MSRNPILLAFISVFVLVALFVITQSVEQAATSEQCAIDTLYVLSHKEQERCVQAAGGKASFMATIEARRIATAEAQPSVIVPTRPRPTQTVTPIGYIPTFVDRIEPVANEGQDWRGTESVWIVGSVQNTDEMHFPFFVWTAEVRCRIGTYLETEASDAPFEGVPIKKYWDCPNDEGILTITDVTNPTGIIAFENEQGQTGTFNLATEAWTFEGEPWLAPARSEGTTIVQ